jgi:DNA-binding MarR family transcriptional regulator
LRQGIRDPFRWYDAKNEDSGCQTVRSSILGGRVESDGSGGDAGPVGEAGSADEVLRAVWAFTRGIDRYRHAVGRQLHLGLAEIITLAQLLYDEPLRASEVGDRTGLSQSSVTALLDRLARAGYITRARPPDNRRVVLVELTVAGRELGQGAFRPVVLMLEKVAAEPDAPDPSRLAHCLQRIAELLDELVTATATADNPSTT